MNRSREVAARILRDASWTPQEIAYALRWKIEHVERVLCRRPYISDTPCADAMGMELSVRAGRAIEVLGVETIAALQESLPRLHNIRGFGAKTIGEIDDEIKRIDSGAEWGGRK